MFFQANNAGAPLSQECPLTVVIPHTSSPVAHIVIVILITLSMLPHLACSRNSGANDYKLIPSSCADSVIGGMHAEHLGYVIPTNALERAVGSARYSKVATYWLNGKQVGVRKWHKNGTLASEQPMLNGQTHGYWKFWYEDGRLMSKSPYREGRPEGISRAWYQNGQLSKETPFRLGAKHGAAKEWDTDGAPVEEIIYRNGRKHGVSRFWKNKAGFQGLKFPMGRGTWEWYFINDNKVTRSEYIAASKTNDTLSEGGGVRSRHSSFEFQQPAVTGNGSDAGSD